MRDPKGTCACSFSMLGTLPASSFASSRVQSSTCPTCASSQCPGSTQWNCAVSLRKAHVMKLRIPISKQLLSMKRTSNVGSENARLSLTDLSLCRSDESVEDLPQRPPRLHRASARNDIPQLVPYGLPSFGFPLHIAIPPCTCKCAK